MTADPAKGPVGTVYRRRAAWRAAGAARTAFAEWGERYLDSDPEGRSRSPPAVETPGGAFQDIFKAWAGDLSYEPVGVRAPVAIKPLRALSRGGDVSQQRA
jgi:hypothetical protein